MTVSVHLWVHLAIFCEKSFVKKEHYNEVLNILLYRKKTCFFGSDPNKYHIINFVIANASSPHVSYLSLTTPPVWHIEGSLLRKMSGCNRVWAETC